MFPKCIKVLLLLSYEQQQINPAHEWIPNKGEADFGKHWPTLQELVTSRTSLEKVITQFSLYEGARKRLPIDDVIETMRKDIDIKPCGARGYFQCFFSRDTIRKR